MLWRVETTQDTQVGKETLLEVDQGTTNDIPIYSVRASDLEFCIGRSVDSERECAGAVR